MTNRAEEMRTTAVKRVGARTLIVTGLVSMMAGLGIIAMLPASTPVWRLSVLMMLVGLAGPFVSPLTASRAESRPSGVAADHCGTARQRAEASRGHRQRRFQHEPSGRRRLGGRGVRRAVGTVGNVYAWPALEPAAGRRRLVGDGGDELQAPGDALT